MNPKKRVELVIAVCALLALLVRPAFADPPSEETTGENVSVEISLNEALRNLVRREASLAEARGEVRTIAPILVEGMEEPYRIRTQAQNGLPDSLSASPPQIGNSIQTMRNGGIIVTERNPNAQRVNTDVSEMDPEEALDSIVASAGHMILRQDRSGVRNIIRTDMVADSRWPLNWPLGSIAQQELTLAEAWRHLENQFNLVTFRSQQSVISGHESEVAWRPNGENPTARDLVNAIIARIAAPGEYFKIQISTPENLPHGDTADISTWPASAEIRWHLVAVSW